MGDQFQEEVFWMLRESKGYFPWIQEQSYRLVRHLRFGHGRHCPMCEERPPSTRDIVRATIGERTCENPLFDLVMKALIRAEVRLISRFIPQQSHEERLTGNLVSEIDSAIFLIRAEFRRISLELYATEKDADFFYYDVSRGGKLEKTTGADLGLIAVVNLPAFPYTVKSLILQAKKMNGNSAKIERQQYETLLKHGANACAYLLCDMDLARRCCPLVVGMESHRLKKQYDECAKQENRSFSYQFDMARADGYPLSLFLVSHLVYDESIGHRHRSFEEALRMFSELGGLDSSRAAAPLADFNGRVAVVSVGRPVRFTTPDNEGLRIEV